MSQVHSKKNEPLSLPYQSEKFIDAWLDFAEMRRVDKKNPLTERATKIIFKKLSKWGEKAAIKSLEKSTVSQWLDVWAVRPDELKSNTLLDRY